MKYNASTLVKLFSANRIFYKAIKIKVDTFLKQVYHFVIHTTRIILKINERLGLPFQGAYDVTDLTSNSVVQELFFLSNGYRLKGTLHLPSTPFPSIVFGSHGLLSTSKSPKQIELAHQCNAVGIAFFRFDHRGCGESEGDYKDIASLTGRCEDLARAIETIRLRNDIGGKIGFFGSSMGGAVSISSANRFKPDAMVTYAAPIRSRNINEVLEKEPDDNQTIGPLHDLNELKFDLSDHLSNLHNILVIHGDADQVVPVSHAHSIHNSARKPKKLILQKNGDHPMNNRVHQKNFIRETISWFKQYLLN
ncbi:MAG: alpha/beta hydrolase [Deltaproteobacteria bacterium]|nr:alpha/beta hydrolase [Deltaproteobacteria bacterium]